LATLVGISGFGAIGRRILRAALEGGSPIRIAAVNDLMDNATMAHLFKYDSTFGTWPGDVGYDEEALLIDGTRIRAFHQRAPEEIPWKEAGVGLVLECTGLFRSREGAAGHLRAGAKKVLISAPGTDEDIMVIYGVNHKDYDPSRHDIVSNGSCTTNCLVPILKIMDDALGVEDALMTTVHSYTGEQALLDAPKKDLRRARTASQSIVPTTTGAAKAVTQVLPHLEGRVTGLALRVPTPSVSITDLTAHVKTEISAGELNAVYESAAKGPYRHILQVTHDPIVSVDLRKNPHSAIVDAPLTKTAGRLVKVLAWYDNEWGYSNRMVDVASYMADAIG